MKNFLLIISLALLSACTPTTNSVDGDFQKPPELADCKFFEMRSSGALNLMVVRCPNSTTSTQMSGKQKKRVIVIDGVEFEQKS